MANLFEKLINNAAKSVEPSAEFTQDLWKRIKMTPRKTREPRIVSKKFWIPSVSALGVMLILIIVGPQTVLAAFRSLLSYIPGIGFIQKGETTLFLEKPVVVKQDGYSFTVDNVVADAEKVVVAYHLSGTSGDIQTCTYDGNQIILPNGKSRLPINGGSQPASAKIDFASLPAGVTKFSIKATINDPDSLCPAPKEWNVAVSLATTSPDLEILPVIENTPAQNSTSNSTSTSSSTNTDVQFLIDKYVELTDGYLLTGKIVASDKSWRNVSIDMEKVEAFDAAGKNIPLEQTDESLNDNEFAIKVVGKNFALPLSIHVNNMVVIVAEETPPSFSFDAGKDPQIGQNWTIDQEIEIAGKKIYIKDVKVVEDTSKINYPTSVKGFAINATSADNINLGFDCSGNKRSDSSWDQSMPGNGNKFSVENYFPNGIPNGVVTCKILNAFIQEGGDWKFQWQPNQTAK